MTLVCGTAGFDGTQFKGLLASRYNIQLNKTSRNSVLLQSNINNTRSDVAHLIRVLVEISHDIDQRLTQGGPNVRKAFERTRQEPHDRRARSAELLAFPRSLPERMRASAPMKGISAAASIRPMTRPAANTSGWPTPRSTGA